jgi:hypothetical protein
MYNICRPSSALTGNKQNCYFFISVNLVICFWRNSPPRARAASTSRFLEYPHNDAPHSVELLWTKDRPVARPLPDNTRHSQQTDIHAPSGIRIPNLSKRAAADWDRQFNSLQFNIYSQVFIQLTYILFGLKGIHHYILNKLCHHNCSYTLLQPKGK